MHLKSILMSAGVAAATVAFVIPCSGSDNSVDVTKGVVLQNATVVNTRDGSLSSGMSVVVDQGKIQKIAAASNVHASGTAQVVDATGKYIVPGFNDMHSHSMAYANQTPTLWPLLIANGVTGIREMSGTPDLIAAARKLNIDSAAGVVDAPEILLTTGPVLSGINSAALGVQRVQDDKAMGADFVKMWQATRDGALAIFDEAKRQGLPVAGHLPGPSVSAVEASNLGMRSMEHYGSGYGILLDCATDEASVRQALVNGQGAPTPYNPSIATYRVGDAPFYQRIIDTYSESKCVSVAQTFVKNDTWLTPTLIRLHTIAISGDPLYQTDPNLKYVDKKRRAVWAAYGAASIQNIPPVAQASFVKFYSLLQKFTKLMKVNGVKMMTGTEVSSTLIIPGFSMHREFQELAAAGLSPLEILQMSTLNPAQFLGREATMGSVDEGKTADLVVLDANPLVDIANFAKISGVVLKGRYFSQTALDKMKADVADEYARQPVAGIGSAVMIAHED